jgi:hypothetical protein
MIHSGGRGRRRRRRRRRGSKGPYERGGGGDGDQAAKGCMDAAATGAKTGSTLSSGCCAAKAPAWMEEFSGDSTLCKKKVMIRIKLFFYAGVFSFCRVRVSVTA